MRRIATEFSLLLGAGVLLALPSALPAQTPTRAEATAALAPTTRYSVEQLDQMLAPIALYPDQLLVAVLMAATYPDQVADAAQWLRQPGNGARQGDDLVGAVAPLPWDASVKTLVAFPQVVAMLNAYPEWTETIGLAFADQQAEVMARVQALRLQAWNAGRLRQAPHLRIVREGSIVIIEPAETDVVYVPLYNPAVIYGSWRYSDYPPVYVAPPPGVGGYPPAAASAAWIGFGVGLPIAAPLWLWSRPRWHERRVTIDAAEFGRVAHNQPLPTGGVWRHSGPVRPISRPAPAGRAAEAPHPPGTVSATAVIVARPAGSTAITTKPAPVAHPAPIGHPAPMAPSAPPPALHHALPVAPVAPPALGHRPPQVTSPAPPPPPVLRPAPPPVLHSAPPVLRPAPPPVLRPAPPPVLHSAPPPVLHSAPPPPPSIAHPTPPPIPHPAPPPRVLHPPPPVGHPPPPGSPKNE